MCLTCGCMDAHQEMGADNLTYEDLRRAADENRTSVQEVLERLVATAEIDRAEHDEEYTR